MPATNLRPSRIALLIFIAAFILRLSAVFLLRDIHHGPSEDHGADPMEFNALAIHMAHGEGYELQEGQPTSFRAPGWPMLLAGLYRIAGVNYPAAYLMLCALGACTCVLTYVLGRQLLPEATAGLAGLLAVIYLPHIYFATDFLSESLFALLLAAGTWLFILHLNRQQLVFLMLAGLLLGYAALVRPFALLLLPLFAVLLTRERDVRRHRFLSAAVWAMAFVAAIAPWTVRNYRVHGRVVLIATNGGSTFYGANNGVVSSEKKRWGGWVSTLRLPGRDRIDAMPDEVTHDQMEWQLGKQWLRGHTGSIPLLLATKFVRMWLPDIDSTNKKYVWMQVAGYTPFLLLIIIGVVSFYRQPARSSVKWRVVHVAIAASVLAALIFWGCPRFRDANAPLLMVYAAVGAQEIIAWIKSSLLVEAEMEAIA